MGTIGHFDPGMYGNSRLALKVVDEYHIPIMVLTVNIPDENLDAGEFFVKTWSENEALIPDIMATDLFEDTGRRVPTGRVIAQVWKFKHIEDENTFREGLQPSRGIAG